ncbi:MAG TPA: ATP-binding protein [Mucilaginibacter sp.]|nr:ATP-binding protein [Mucilaginibacter sp.]
MSIGEKFTPPCPCGYYNHPEKECTCPPGTVQKYLSKISGPLLDRIDLHVEVTPVISRNFPPNGWRKRARTFVQG